ncbi:Enoyl LovC [Cyphellophora attinorum]|uniref:Enoyl LovC n=1 Tax=Cyphellophora attinorum TaxID=1664694 RepID=A0A0N1NYG0_9EURO|nr:Enoyl LovC [Phialophora attinorum]KPI36636.1 Enoyl LovC [Phialophora attinorum]
MSTHPQVVTVALGAPLEVRQVSTRRPKGNEVRVRVEWTASTPLDVHQALGGLLVVKYPQGLGDGTAGTVVSSGPNARYQVGDKVFGFTWRSNEEKSHQLYCVAPDILLGKVPRGFTMQQAVTLPNNFVTAWHTLTSDVGFELPWPKPNDYVPPELDEWILVWGGSSSTGQFFIQILKWYGYKNIIATAGKQHHDRLQRYGAAACFDYRSGNVGGPISDFLSQQHQGKHNIRYAIDCIGSRAGSVKPIAEVVRSGATVAVLLPVIIADAVDNQKPVYTLDAEEDVAWAEGVEVRGVRTHFWLDNNFLAEKLQTEIMPAALELGMVEPNEQVVVEGRTLLERAQKAIEMLRRREVSGARLVWRVAEEGEE